MTQPGWRSRVGRAFSGKASRHPLDCIDLFSKKDLAVHGNEKFISPSFFSEKKKPSSFRTTIIGGDAFDREENNIYSGQKNQTGKKRGRMTKAERKRERKRRKKVAKSINTSEVERNSRNEVEVSCNNGGKKKHDSSCKASKSLIFRCTCKR